MSDEKPASAEQKPDRVERPDDLPERVARFAKYTSPMMLAMLVSTGEKAFAS